MNKNKKALVVEDTETAQQLLSLFFSELTWQEPNIVKTGEEALEILESEANNYNVVIVDISLASKMDGFEVFRRAKQSIPKLPPFIMITGYSHDPTLKIKAQEIGIDAFLYKNELNEESFGALLQKVVKTLKYEEN